ncbi:hypothetical protein Ddye_023424 [Dipteronia dyeriana]|uniref:Uncharacterized protein n=1 Tax=Dipteronia dyeriana TaxID=168575 RepID=A0AAD9TTJ2_9ROSI|nr:hypothetical protein Ddye_023424 [Dipteronia dyeriana]
MEISREVFGFDFESVVGFRRAVAVDGTEIGASNNEDLGIGGGPDDTVFVGRGGGEKDRAASNDGRRESVQLHAVVLRR